eukprot:6474133-Amphidinium_carterae.2
MARYSLSPEPRRLWLSVLSRVSGLQAEPLFAAILDRHMVSTNVRTNQTLESVLAFTIAIEAEVDALVQDQTQSTNTGKNTPKAHAAGVGDPTSLASKPGNVGGASSKGGRANDLCKAWGTKEGCRYGKSCKFQHPAAKVADGLCFVCGSTEHKSRLCPRSNKSGGKSKDSKGSGSRPNTPSAGPKPGKGGQVPGSSGGGSGTAKSPRAEGRDRPNSGGGSQSGGRPGSAGKTAGKGGKDKKSDRRPSTPRDQTANPARALSAALDSSISMEGLLDSGASHVIAPMEELSEASKEGGRKVALTLASGKPTESMILHGEVYAQRVRRVLVPFGKVVRQTGLLAIWSRAGLSLLAVDGAGQLRLVYRPRMRQGGMPHLPDPVVAAFQQALKNTREVPRVLSFEDWQELLGDALPVCENTFSVCEGGLDVHGITEETPAPGEMHDPDGQFASLAQENKLACVLERVVEGAERVVSAIESGVSQFRGCLGAVCEREEKSREVVSTTVTETRPEHPCAIACVAKTENAREEIQVRIQQHFQKHGVPMTSSRTNIGQGVRSMLLGLFTRRGVGVTRKTYTCPVLEDIHGLARTCDEQIGYVAISVNVITDSCVPEHRDSNNMGPSYVYVCGDFTGGEFVQGEVCLDVKRGWFRFHGQIPHQVRQVQGTRISVVFYTPNGTHAVRDGVKKQLSELGFPVSSVLAQGVPKLLHCQRALHAEIWEYDAIPDTTGKRVLIEDACFDDSLLSAQFELLGGISIRLGLPNIDLASAQGMKRFAEILRETTSKASDVAVWFAIPCSVWSSLQRLNAHKYGKKWLDERQERAMPLVRAAVQAVRDSVRHGASVIWEWPHKLSGWELDEVKDVLHLLPRKARVDGCSYGFTHGGRPCKKPWLIRSSVFLPGLERYCSCVEPHVSCEGGSHVSKSARYTEQMARAAVKSILKGMGGSVPVACGSETDTEDDSESDSIGFNRDGLLDDLLDDAPAMPMVHADGEDVLVQSDDEDDVATTMSDMFGDGDDDSDDAEIVTNEKPLPEPEAERPQYAILNPEEQLAHEERGHYPKNPFCPVCQLADGPLHQHRKLRKNEVGMLAVDLAGPLYPDLNGKKYIVVAVWVGFHNHRSVSIPFVELVSSRLATEVFDALTKIVDRLENLVSPILPGIEHGMP